MTNYIKLLNPLLPYTIHWYKYTVYVCLLNKGILLRFLWINNIEGKITQIWLTNDEEIFS